MRVHPLHIGLVLALMAPAAHAAWPEVPTGLVVSNAFSDQHLPAMIADGQGGAMVVWSDLRTGQYDIRAQRISPAGHALWQADGVVVCDATGQQILPVLVADGTGGAIIAWEDDRGGMADVYAQRIDANGERQWAANGVALCTAMDDQVELAIVTDGAGGAIVAWTDLRKGTEADLHAQRVNAAGVPQWTANGVAVAAQARDQYGARLVSDGSTGAFVTWNDTRVFGRQDVYAARITSAGVMPWTAGGVRVALTAGGQGEPTIANDSSGGVYVAWADMRHGTGDIAAQRLNGTGVRQWGDSARVICRASGAQGAPRIVQLASGPCVVWQDARGASPDLYMQRLDGNGLPQWTIDGRLAAGGPGAQDRPDVLPGTGDELLMVWQDRRNASLDVYAQRFAADGTERWSAGGLAVCTVSGEQRYPVLASDASDGAIIVWEDQRDFAPDLYGHRVLASGLLGGPQPRITAVADVPGDEGGKVRLEWSRSRYEDPAFGSLVDRYRVERLDASGPVAIDSVSAVFGEGPPLLEMLVPTLQDASTSSPGRTAVRVVAVFSGGTFASAPDSGASLDNLGPEAVTGLSARIEGATTRIAWRRSSSADAVKSRVHRGTFIAFPTDSSTLVATTTDSVLVLAYSTPSFYKVVAVDEAENAGAEAWVFSEATLGAPDAPLGFEFARPAPDPSHGPLALAFSIAVPCDVRLELFDPRGRRVRVLRSGPLAAGRHIVTWDGRDHVGRPTAAGVYFVRLRAGSDERSHRVTRVE